MHRYAILIGLSLIANASAADPADDVVNGIAVPIVGGTVKLDMRARWEHADIDTFHASNAYTLRTRLGYGTQAWEGLSAYVEMENISTADRDAYFDGIPPNTTDRSVIPDPTDTEVNQAFGVIDRPDFGNTKVIGGRQRIVLDDQRFIGNVGWRQNEQTYDGVWAQSGFFIDRFTFGYGYIADVHRVFGDQGTRATEDYDSMSHLARVAYDVAPWLQPVAFAYLLDLRDAPAQSSNTYGLRLTGTAPFAEDWSVIYQGTYAFQTDGGTTGGKNPVNYHAHYALADLALGYAPLGAVGAGYELLGSDDGRARVVTPLATAHKFTGWADAIDNVGAEGIQDLYVYVSPALPWKVVGQVVYHQFWSHEGGRNYGHEVDASLSRKFGAYLTVLAKGAWYEDGSSATTPPDTMRMWLEATVAF
jgi:hypothetical protein